MSWPLVSIIRFLVLTLDISAKKPANHWYERHLLDGVALKLTEGEDRSDPLLRHGVWNDGLPERPDLVHVSLTAAAEVL